MTHQSPLKHGRLSFFFFSASWVPRLSPIVLQRLRGGAKKRGKRNSKNVLSASKNNEYRAEKSILFSCKRLRFLRGKKVIRCPIAKFPKRKLLYKITWQMPFLTDVRCNVHVLGVVNNASIMSRANGYLYNVIARRSTVSPKY